MKLSDYLNKEYINVKLEAKSKNDLLEKIIHQISGDSEIIDKSKLKADILKREKDSSTGIGNGVALPHAKTKATRKPIIGISTLLKGIEYGSVDSELVNIVFLLVVPDNQSIIHLKFLSQIAKTVQLAEIRYRLYESNTTEDIYSIILEKEIGLK